MKIREIDLRHLGNERVICAWLVGDVIVDPGPASCLEALLEGLGGIEPRALALTHIHLDHAGASGSLVERWPDLEVWVHARGARHMVAPGKLIASAERLYGAEMERLWGEMLPVPEERLRVLEGGERLGEMDVLYTPGHASHHVSYLQDGVAFCGDVAGVRIPGSGFLLPPTPPPDIDLEAWQESLARLRRRAPRRLALTHFGGWDDAGDQLKRMGEELERWAHAAQTHTMESFISAQREAVRAAAPDEVARSYDQAVPAEQGWLGLQRYLARGLSSPER